MKKKVLFVVTYFDCGGTCRSLQNLLNRIDTDQIEVDVFGMVEDGMYKSLFENCTIISENSWLRALTARYAQQRGLHKLQSLIAKLLRKFTGGKFGEWITCRAANNLVMSKGYDAIVAFSEGLPTMFVSLMSHPNKIAWVHCDYASYYELNNRRNEVAIYKEFKTVVCVSNFTAISFISIYSELKDKTKVIYNVLDVDMMRQMAKEPLCDTMPDGVFKIISVGRLDPVKRLSVIPHIAVQLKECGCKFYWYIVGPKGGTDEEYNKLMANIERYNVSDCVRWMREQNNPYNFIANADLLVCTSISEACPYVVNEAKTLNVPVICTDFGSAGEFVESGISGYSTSLEYFPERIASLINDRVKYREIKENLLQFEYENTAIIESICKIL